jgi:hypothetical protein
MRTTWRTCALALALVIGVGGCSGGGSGATPSSTAPAGNGTAAEGGTPSAPQTTLPSPSRTATLGGLVSTPSVSPVKVRYATASSTVRRTFAPLTASLKGIAKAPALQGVTLRGAEVGGVARYPVSPAQARSLIFQGQIVTQAVTTLTGTTPGAEVIAGRKVTVAHGRTTVLGWFDRNTIVLITAPDLRTVRSVAAAYLATH